MRPFLAAILLLPALASAELGSLVINHQGRLMEADDTPVNGPVPMTFSLYRTALGSTPVWSQSSTVEVRGGVYTTLLGSEVALEPSHLSDEEGPLWLEVMVNTQALLPRQRLASVSHAARATLAQRARVAETVDCVGCIGPEQLFVQGCSEGEALLYGAGGWSCEALPEGALYDPGAGLVLDGTTFSIASGGVSSSMIAANAVGTSHLAPAAVTSAQLAANAVGSAHLVDGSVVGSKIAAGVVTGSHLATAAVTGAKLASNSVSASHLVDGSITGSKLSPGAYPAIRSTGTLESLEVAGDVLFEGDSLSLSASDAHLSLSGERSRLSLGAENPRARLEVKGTAPLNGTGTVSTLNDRTTTVNGAATRFTTELSVGDTLIVGAQHRTILSISNDTTLQVDRPFSPQLVGGSAFQLQHPVARIASQSGHPGLNVDASGRVGVGTSTPSAALDVQQGALRVGNTIYNALALSLPTTGHVNGSSSLPLHIKTDWICGVTDNVMYNLEFRGHAYLGVHPIHASAVGYLYGSRGHTYNSVHHYVSGVSVSTYCASGDSRLVFRLVNANDWHASDLVVNLIGGGSSYQHVAANTFKVLAAEHRSANF